jgi:galactose mutarotase-like enzyme
MYFTLGAHPGFKVPLEDMGTFEDCYIEFSTSCTPLVMGLSPRCFRSGEYPKFSDEPITTIPLNEELFSNDAIFLKETSGSLCLKSKATKRYIQMDYQGFKFIGLWQPYNVGAPFVCIEPWLGSPSLDGRIDDFKTKEDMLSLDTGKEYSISYKITVK